MKTHLDYIKMIKLIGLLGILFVAMSFIYGWESKEGTLIDESLVSLLAFLLLFLATVMQNHDLNMQREELKNTVNELANQSRSLEEQNRMIKETQSYELLNLYINRFNDLLDKHDEYVNSMRELDNEELDNLYNLKRRMEHLRKDVPPPIRENILNHIESVGEMKYIVYGMYILNLCKIVINVEYTDRYQYYLMLMDLNSKMSNLKPIENNLLTEYYLYSDEQLGLSVLGIIRLFNK